MSQLKKYPRCLFRVVQVHQCAFRHLEKDGNLQYTPSDQEHQLVHRLEALQKIKAFVFSMGSGGFLELAVSTYILSLEHGSASYIYFAVLSPEGKFIDKVL